MSEIVLSASTSEATSAVDWNDYARCYDLLCSLNPAYTELLNEFRSFAIAAVSPGSRILDLGGGTGNFFCSALPSEIAASVNSSTSTPILECCPSHSRNIWLAIFR